jgi:hypothetical protein
MTDLAMPPRDRKDDAANRHAARDYSEVVGPSLATDHGGAQCDGFGVGHQRF